MARTRRRGRRRRPAAVPAVRQPMDPVRAPVSSLELTPAELRRRARDRRARGRRPHAVLVERDVPRRGEGRRRASCSRSTSRAAASGRCGTSRTARCASARSRRSSSPTRSAGTSCRHRAARRPARCRRGAALRRARSRRALLHAARRPRRRASVEFACVRRAGQQHRPQGRPLPARPGERRDRRHRPRRSRFHDAVEAAHRDLGLRGRARCRPRPPTTCAASSPSSTTARCTNGSRPCSTSEELDALDRRAQVLLDPRPAAPRRLAQHPLAPRLTTLWRPGRHYDA